MPFDLSALKRHKVAFVIGGLVAGGIAFYAYEKNKSAGSTAAAPPGSSSFGYGYGYGLGASGALYGYGYGAYGYGAYGYGGFPGGGVPGGVGVPQPPVPPPAPPPASNAQWAQEAETALTAQGYNGLHVAAALGKYLTAQTLTADQESIVQTAIAFENYPPVPGPHGFPPAIHTQQHEGQKGAKKVKVPKATGIFYSIAAARVKAAGLVPRRGEPNVGWVRDQNPRAGTMAEKGSIVILSNPGQQGAPHTE